ncbi:MAG TPA: primosomal protein N' [Candidatus Bathyarchaeia archaeon]|nr:primosomal protein N' [Candidatus Bathyarchaeia archaeon]
MKKYIIQIAPIVPLPVLRTQIFSYWHSEALPAGTLVSIPFYFREIQGIVINVRKNDLQEGSLKLKNINAVVEEKFLSENQVELARRIADFYFAPLGTVLKHMIPKAAGHRVKKKKICKVAPKTEKISEEAKGILASRKNKFLLTGNGKAREKINLDLIRACLKENKQCLILAPEIFFSQSLHEKLQSEFSEEIALVHSRITKGEYFGYWKRVRFGELKIVIASKLGIFLPFSSLGMILVHEEQDASFKQWESMPRYNAARGAEFLAEISGAKLVLESFVPAVESLYRAKTGELELIKTKNATEFPEIEVVQLEGERKNPDFPISKALYGRLAQIVNEKKQAVVFVNRRGFSTRTICENCNQVLKCPKCRLALVFSEEHGQYRCLHCAFKMDLLSACPTCGGFQFSHRGIGTQTVEKKIKKLFPSARVSRLDADALISKLKSQDILQNFAAGEIDILVGTQAVIKGIYSGNIGLAASISGRDFADEIEYNSRAVALSRIFQMANLLDINGILMIQSFFGGSPLLNQMEKSDSKKYFASELALRKRFSYPPFRKFVKLAYRDKSEKKVVSETKKAFDLLVATSDNGIEIIGPYHLLSEQKRGIYLRNILLKIDPKKNIRELPIRSVIGALRKGWSVDVDPISLF